MDSDLAPICLFVYNRLQETRETIRALKDNPLAKESELFIYSDGPKDKIDTKKVLKLRCFLSKIKGFKSLTIIEAKKNQGLADSIISGVTKVLERYSKVIVLEDDLVTASNFLDFMNSALKFYDPSTIFCISGFTLDLNILKDKKEDVYFGPRASSWGWGVWKLNWDDIDWKVETYPEFRKSRTKKRSFNKGGSDLSAMLKNQVNGRIDSWAIRFCYEQFLDKKPTVFPTKSKVQNIGFSKEATHTSGAKHFITNIDTELKVDFNFRDFNGYDPDILNQVKKVYSIRQRIINKIRKVISG